MRAGLAKVAESAFRSHRKPRILVDARPPQVAAAAVPGHVERVISVMAVGVAASLLAVGLMWRTGMPTATAQQQPPPLYNFPRSGFVPLPASRLIDSRIGLAGGVSR
jgi:hypothetical protein